MIKITNLSKSYGKKKVLENLNCNIKTNSIYGLVGANGAGKSTLLRIINDVFRRDSGKIEIDGLEIEDNDELKQKLVFVPDDLYFFAGYTLKDMAKFYKDMYINFDMKYLEELASILKLDMNEKIQNFSKGMKRQCALICAIATNADYMFFDETFDGVDPVIRNLLKKIIVKQMQKKETTIIMTSHNLRELEDICDNLGLLYKGGILFESDIDTLKTNMFKIQISLKEEFNKETFDMLEIMNFKKLGSIATIIAKGDKEFAKEKLEKLNPVVLDFLPLTLEEMFIYEMEVLGYEFNQII
ncbi:MAG: ABC transporter ATP-binding protein [Clostridia bacterium]|jgi:ABC-2 type transport system ATP-binding protein|nr:ABC transporter ATP-binding protein [Clostridia bacterium]